MWDCHPAESVWNVFALSGLGWNSNSSGCSRGLPQGAEQVLHDHARTHHFRIHQWQESRTVQCEDVVPTTSVTLKEKALILCYSSLEAALWKWTKSWERQIHRLSQTCWTAIVTSGLQRKAGLFTGPWYRGWLSRCYVLLYVKLQWSEISYFLLQIVLHWAEVVNIPHFSKSKFKWIWYSHINNNDYQFYYAIVGLWSDGSSFSLPGNVDRLTLRIFFLLHYY